MDSYDEKDVPGGEEQARRPGPDAADGGPQAAPGAAAPAPTSEDVTPAGAPDAAAFALDGADAAASAPGASATPAPGASNLPAPAPGASAPASADITAHESPAPGVPGRGIAGLSLPYQVAAALALAGVAVVGLVHIAMVFLHVAPSNTVTKQHGKVVDDWIYPEFEQNWKLFAPNPLQQNIAVQARAEIRMADGTRKTTGWIDLSAGDGSGIRGNPLPSHTQQNELRRGWEFFINSHTDDNKPNGLRGELSDRYIHRIVMLRLGARRDGGTVERVQVRSVTTSVKAPRWSDEKIDTRPYYRVVPWWTVTPSDLPAGAGSADARTEAGR
ncbi:DUF5819 family protein [Streptomyces melanogenes]|uniref:DUF5819 family protein n=1 Tax=Streptomyces melanogenes TaxID=67326 RepID=UPI0037917E0D